jgi:lipid A 4'-phosphatase
VLNQALPGWLLAASVAASLAFALLPQLDLVVSGWFAQGTHGFPLQHDPWLGLINRNVLKLSRAASALLLGLWLLSLLLPAGSWLGARRRALAFVFVALALGPGLLVNSLIKEISGRARPVQVEQFGGLHRFSPAFTLADECDRNCSFVSGHVAAATMPVAGWFLAATRRRRRLWLATGLGLGLASGLARLAVGAHFLSDVVLAMLLTWLACALVAAVMFGRQAVARVATVASREVDA